MILGDNVRQYLNLCFQEAETALKEGNYPIGSIIIDNTGKIISRKRNQCSTDNDITSHAEILSLREIGISDQTELTLFSSLEPCFGCSFFIARSKISYIYSALKDPHKGGLSDLKKQDQFSGFFQNIEITNEPFADLKEKSRNLMMEYFLKLGKTDSAKYYGYQYTI